MYVSLNEELSHPIVVYGCPRQHLPCSDTKTFSKISWTLTVACVRDLSIKYPH